MITPISELPGIMECNITVFKKHFSHVCACITSVTISILNLKIVKKKYERLNIKIITKMFLH